MNGNITSLPLDLLINSGRKTHLDVDLVEISNLGFFSKIENSHLS